MHADSSHAVDGSSPLLTGSARAAGRLLLLVAATALALPATSRAAAVDKLRAFNREVQTARAQFTQVVVDRTGRKVQEASGTLLLSRPGLFRWNYEKPYRQLIVGDGKRVWIYDEDLNQVTVKNVDQALGATPASLLSGAQDVEKAFVVTDAPDAGRMEWLVAKPRGSESAFTEVRIGFEGATPAQLELLDSFGQRTTIRLEGLERNPKLGADSFRFSPPKGADVIGDRPL